MKLVSFRHGTRDSYGAVVGDGVVDLGARLGGRHASLRAALLADALNELRQAAEGAAADLALADAMLLPVIPDAPKILCAGVNYEEHRQETGRPKSTNPVIFTRYADSQVGHGQPMVKPKVSNSLDYEGELAVILGRTARNLRPEDAYRHIAGYACYNDGSVRDWQYHTSQFTPGKNFPNTGAFGPWMVTADEIPDPAALTLVTRLNGQEMQRATTDMMIFDIPALMAYITAFTTLNAGDVILTGTPGGVGGKRNPPVFMKNGDVIEVEISGVGLLRNPVVAE